MSPFRHRSGLLLFMGVLLSLLLSACTSAEPARRFGFGARAPQEFIRIEVVNDNFADMTIFAMGGGANIRLGDVTGKSTATFSLDPAQLSPSSALRLLADPLGSRNAFLSDEVVPGRGAVVVLNVAPSLQMSYVTLR